MTAEAAGCDEIINADDTNKLLLIDDNMYVDMWQLYGFNQNAHYMPAGSMVEGACQARNAAGSWFEIETDMMIVSAWVTSTGPDHDPVLVPVPDSKEHVLVPYPHPCLRIWLLVGQLQEEWRAPWINGCKLKQYFLQNIGSDIIAFASQLGGDPISSVTGPSVAINIQMDKVSPDFELLNSAVTQCRRLMSAVLPLTDGAGDDGQQRRVCDLLVRELVHTVNKVFQTLDILTIGRSPLNILKFAYIVSKPPLVQLTSDVPLLEGLLESWDITQLQEYTTTLASVLSHIERGIEICYILRDSVPCDLSNDFVPAIHVTFWPQQAKEWRSRPRKWPPQDVIQKVLDRGFHLVSKPRTHLPAEETEYDWRISFSLSEQIIARHRSPSQRKVYHLLKAIYYKYLKPIGTSDTSLKSYACKTVMLWVSEEQDARWWEENSTLTALTHLLKRLLKCLQERRMSYYFIPEVNLFDGWRTPQKVVTTCAAVITGLLYSRPREYLASKVELVVRLVFLNTIHLGSQDTKKLVTVCATVKSEIDKALSVYTSTATRALLPRGGSGDDVDVCEDLGKILNMWQTICDRRRQCEVKGEAHECTSLHDRVRATWQRNTPISEHGSGVVVTSASELFTSIWKNGLLKSVLGFLNILTKDKRLLDYSDICQGSRQLVKLFPPHVLCDAQMLCCEDLGLDNVRLIEHFITVIQNLERARRDIDALLDFLVSHRITDTYDFHGINITQKY